MIPGTCGNPRYSQLAIGWFTCVLLLLGSIHEVLAGETYLTLHTLGTATQPHEGIWIRAGQGAKDFRALGGSRVVVPFGRAAVVDGTAKRGDRIEKARLPHAQFDRIENDCWRGLAQFIQKAPTPECRQFAWWGPAALCFSPDNVATLTIDGRIIDGKTCQLTSAPDPITVPYQRYSGLRFGFVKPGKRIGITGGPGQGKLVLKLHWDYQLLRPGFVRLRLEKPQGTELVSRGAAYGDYTFSGVLPAKYVFVAEAFGNDGSLIHRDVAVADLK